MKSILKKLLMLFAFTAAISLKTNAQELTISAVVTDNQCFGDNDGAIDIDVDPPGSYTYYWNGVLSTEDISSLPNGVYTVVVTDGSLTSTATYNVSSPSHINVSGVVTNGTCSGTKGKITLSVSGGTPGYTYIWNDFTATKNRTNLLSGVYTVTVSDYNGCTSTASYTVAATGSLNIKFSFVQNATCTNAGKLSASVTGGSGSYTYVWKTCAGATITPITPNKINANSCSCYQVTVSNGLCTATRSYTIPKVTLTKPSNCKLKATLTCNTDFGSVDSYLWNNNALLNTETIDCISSGNYLVLIKNANGDALTTCNKAITVTPLAVTDIRLNSTGARVIFTVTGGCSPYVAAWAVSPTGTLTYYNTATITNGQVKKLSGLRTYTVTLTDACGHTVTATSSTTLRMGDEPIENMEVANEFTVFPNPSTGIFTINFNDVEMENADFIVYNTSGQIVLQKQILVDDNNSTQIDLTNQPKGIYCVRVTNGSAIMRTQKVILN